MAALDPAAFEHCFLARARDLVAAIEGQVVALGGKTSRRSDDRPHDKERLHKERLHLVSAWASANPLVLGQVALNETSNEVGAILVGS